MYKQTFDVKTSTALKAIAVLMMLFHHCFLSQNLYQNYLVIFTPFTENTVVTVSNMFKICVSIFAFISGYGLYLNYSKTELTPVQWVVAREI